jgi:hypothetical protein
MPKISTEAHPGEVAIPASYYHFQKEKEKYYEIKLDLWNGMWNAVVFCMLPVRIDLPIQYITHVVDGAASYSDPTTPLTIGSPKHLQDLISKGLIPLGTKPTQVLRIELLSVRTSPVPLERHDTILCALPFQVQLHLPNLLKSYLGMESSESYGLSTPTPPPLVFDSAESTS